jgi:hypothetical protein
VSTDNSILLLNEDNKTNKYYMPLSLKYREKALKNNTQPKPINYKESDIDLRRSGLKLWDVIPIKDRTGNQTDISMSDLKEWCNRFLKCILLPAIGQRCRTIKRDTMDSKVAGIIKNKVNLPEVYLWFVVNYIEAKRSTEI